MLVPPHSETGGQYEIPLKEWFKCRFSFLYFLETYVKISDEERGVIPFESWPHLVTLADTFLTHKEIIILKARQLGISWFCAAYALWKALFFEGAQVLLISQGEEEATKLLGKCKFIHLYLPTFLRHTPGSEGTALITFPHLHSEIRALSSTEKAGHGYSATLVVRDELEYHPYGDENFAAISPAMDAGGQMIDLSTVNKKTLTSHFKERYKKARSGENGAFPVFIPWSARPVRRIGISLGEWRSEMARKYTALQLEQEYPETEDEAFRPSRAVAYFDPKAIDEMQNDCYSPKEERYSGAVKIWKPPIVGGRYVIATDPSDGKEDPHAIIVLDWATMEVVADSHDFFPAEEVAKIHDELVRYYNNAFNTYERNAIAGGVVETTLQNLGTPNQYHPKQGKEDTGFWMSNSKQSSGGVRQNLLWRLEAAIRNRQLRVHDLAIVNDLISFIRPTGDVPQASAGAHDDFVMALAIALEMRKMMPTAANMVFKTVALRRA